VVVEDAVITVTRDGYAKRMNEKTYARSNREADLDLAQGDAPIALLRATTAQKLWLFTASGAMIQVPVADLAEGRWRDKGSHLSAIVPAMGKQDPVCAVFVAEQLSDKAELLFVTRQGMGKRVAVAEFATRSRKIAGCGLKEGDELLMVAVAQRGTTLIMVSQDGMALATRPSQFSAMGRTAKGVKAMQLEDDDVLVFAAQLGSEAEVALMTNTGYAKRVPVPAFTTQNRGGKGVRVLTPQKNGANGNRIAGCVAVEAPGTMVVMQQRGETTRLQTDGLAVRKPDGRFELTEVLIMNPDNGIERVYLQLQ